MEIGRFRTALAVLASILPACAAAQESYVIDTSHTIPMYEVTHLGFSQQRGTFTKATGRASVDRAARKGTIDVSIATASVSTGSPALGERLRGPDFLDVERFPAMTYRSSELKFDGENVVGADGELTLRGVTRPVTLKIAGFKCGTNPMNRRAMCGGEASATLLRSEFGMHWGLPAIVSDEVRITIPFEAARE
jgi:polyisoprenoid-binding protein YceI